MSWEKIIVAKRRNNCMTITASNDFALLNSNSPYFTEFYCCVSNIRLKSSSMVHVFDGRAYRDRRELLWIHLFGFIENLFFSSILFGSLGVHRPCMRGSTALMRHMEFCWRYNCHWRCNGERRRANRFRLKWNIFWRKSIDFYYHWRGS